MQHCSESLLLRVVRQPLLPSLDAPRCEGRQGNLWVCPPTLNFAKRPHCCNMSAASCSYASRTVHSGQSPTCPDSFLEDNDKAGLEKSMTRPGLLGPSRVATYAGAAACKDRCTQVAKMKVRMSCTIIIFFSQVIGLQRLVTVCLMIATPVRPGRAPVALFPCTALFFITVMSACTPLQIIPCIDYLNAVPG